MREKCTITQQIFVPLWPIFQLKARNCQLPTLTPCKLFKNSDPKSKQSYSTIAACCTYSWKSFKMDAENTPGMWVCCRFLWPFYAILLTLKASFYCMEIWLTWQWKIGSGRTLWAVIGGGFVRCRNAWRANGMRGMAQRISTTLQLKARKLGAARHFAAAGAVAKTRYVCWVLSFGRAIAPGQGRAGECRLTPATASLHASFLLHLRIANIRENCLTSCSVRDLLLG